MVAQPIRVIIADDHPTLINGLQKTIETTSQIQVVGAALSFDEVLTLVKRVAADVLVLDLGGMGSAPITFVHSLRLKHPDIALAIFSTSIDLAPEMIQAGALGYIAKEEPTERVIDAIMTVAGGHPWYSAKVEEYLKRSTGARHVHQLAPKELSVLKLLAQGKSTTEVASELKIDPRSVYNYITSMRRKVGCEERSQLIDWYRRVCEEGVSQ